MKRLMLAVVMAVLLFCVQRAHAATDALHDYIFQKCLVEFERRNVAEEKATYYTPMVRRVAKANGIPELTLAALVWYESNYRPNCISSAGALGLCQIMPFHFPSYGFQVRDWKDPVVNLTLGCRILRDYHNLMEREYHGLPEEALWHRALVCYNMGPGGVSRGITRSRYSEAIMHDARRGHISVQ
jgi:soluble lytic murein transglycosylase-like protein